ncbi:MAG: DUF6576 domain-containing protein [Chitinophagaceae bacterium]
MIGGGIPLWALTALYIISDLATVSISDTGNLIAHLGGALAGFLFVVFLRMGYDLSNWMSNFFDWVNNLFNPDKPKKGKSIKDELFYKASSAPYTKTSNVTQQRIDEILDKISQKGYNLLTDEEKDLLKKGRRRRPVKVSTHHCVFTGSCKLHQWLPGSDSSPSGFSSIPTLLWYSFSC